MLFSSYIFAFVFFPITALAFSIGRQLSARVGIGVLVASSLYFYAAWRFPFLFLFLASVLVNYALGLLMESSGRRQSVGIIGVVLNLALLAYFKYAAFVALSLNALGATALPVPSIVLPIGISFFTFQQIAYLVDVMRGEKAERDLLSYTLFVSFFPHLIAGPLVHHAEMIPQFKNPRPRRFAILAARGVAIFIAGLFKKVVLADSFAQFATPAFSHADAGGVLTTREAWIATLSYALQIYFDFSGYSDMALGLALVFGIRLPVNFRSPYQARSIVEFWRRWHITLSRFLRDYLYVPLGGNRRGPARRHLNLMITMLLGGLWHGAGWLFVIWGGLHGGFLVVNHLWRRHAAVGMRPVLFLIPAALRVTAGWMLTFSAVTLAWVFFRAETVTGATTVLLSIFGLQDHGGPRYPGPGPFRFADLPLASPATSDTLIAPALVAAGLVLVTALPNVPRLFGFREWRRATEPAPARFARWRPTAAWAAIMAVAFMLCIFGMWQRLEFLYFRF